MIKTSREEDVLSTPKKGSLSSISKDILNRFSNFVSPTASPTRTPPPIVVTSEITGRVLMLAVPEFRLLFQSWQQMPEREERIALFFYNFLKKVDSPVLNAFGVDPFTIPTSAQLNAHPMMKMHIVKFRSFLDDSIRFLDESRNNEFVNLIRTLGSRHDRKPNLTFTAEKWLFFKNEFLAMIAEQNFGSDETQTTTQNAWAKYFIFVVAEMKDAYMQAILCNNSTHNSPKSKTLAAAIVNIHGQIDTAVLLTNENATSRIENERKEKVENDSTDVSKINQSIANDENENTLCFMPGDVML